MLFVLLLLKIVNRTHQYTPSNVFIGGFGYTGSRLASAICGNFPGCKISGTVRSRERRDDLIHSSSRPPWLSGDAHVLDIDDQYIGLDSEGLSDLMEADTVIQTVAPIADFDRDPILAFHEKQLASSNSLKYVAYISSTGVYGDHNGEWVCEEDKLLCSDAKSLARVQAERDWGKLEQEGIPLRVDCFRCGGIYGPGRGPLFSSLESLLEAATLESENDKHGESTPLKYVNRILVDDICSAILSGICGNRPIYSGGRPYNLVDDDPAPRRDVVTEARRLLLASSDTDNGTSLPTSSSVASRNVRKKIISRGTGNKRCSNARLKKDYGWKPTAPTFREGLASLMHNSELL